MQPDIVTPLIQHLEKNTELWVDFMMKFELNLERPNPNRTWISALTIGFSYLLGGFFPLIPYIFIVNTEIALLCSAGVTICALFFFGYFKAIAMGSKRKLQSALQMTLTGALAGASAYLIAQAIPQV